MLGTHAAALAVLLVVGALASVDFVDSIQQEFRMAMVLPRASSNLQTFNGALGGVQAAAVRSALASYVFCCCPRLPPRPARPLSALLREARAGELGRRRGWEMR